MTGGSYLVTRRIRMLIEVWDRASARPTRRRRSAATRPRGAPLTGTAEHDELDLKARSADGLVIPADAHVRLAAPATNSAARMLRRGYSFTDGFDPELGQLDAGLFFIATSATRRRSSTCRTASAPRTRSTSTSSTSAARSSRCRAARGPVA